MSKLALFKDDIVNIEKKNLQANKIREILTTSSNNIIIQKVIAFLHTSSD